MERGLVTRRASLTAVGLVVALLVATAGTGAATMGEKQKKASAKAYAVSVCRVYSGVEEDFGDLVSGYNALAADDPVAFQSQVVTMTSNFLDEATESQAKLARVYPDVDGGKKISKIFVAGLGEIVTKVQEARDAFAAADPSSPGFIGNVTQFEVAFNILDATLGDPFSEVDNQDLMGAFDDAKVCKDVVTVYGG